MARSLRDDDDEEDDDKPRKKRRPVENDDDEEDDKPRKKRRVVDHDDDEEDDDEPKKKSKYRPKQKGDSSKLLLLGGVAVLLFLLCGGGAVGVYFLFFNDSPKAAVEDFIAAAEKGDGGRMWDRLDKKSQEDISKAMEYAKSLPENAKHKDKKGRDLFVALTADNKEKNKNNDLNPFAKDKPVVDSYTVSSDGKSGSVIVKNSAGKNETIPVVKEDGRWRISLSGIKGK